MVERICRQCDLLSSFRLTRITDIRIATDKVSQIEFLHVRKIISMKCKHLLSPSSWLSPFSSSYSRYTNDSCWKNCSLMDIDREKCLSKKWAFHWTRSLSLWVLEDLRFWVKSINSIFFPHRDPFQIHCCSPHVFSHHFSWFVFDSLDCVMQVLENLFFSVGVEFMSDWVVFDSVLYANEIESKVSQQTRKVFVYWICLVGSAFGNLKYVSDYSVLFL